MKVWLTQMHYSEESRFEGGAVLEVGIEVNREVEEEVDGDVAGDGGTEWLDEGRASGCQAVCQCLLCSLRVVSRKSLGNDISVHVTLFL